MLITADQDDQLSALADATSAKAFERRPWLGRSEEAAKAWMRENPD